MDNRLMTAIDGPQQGYSGPHEQVVDWSRVHFTVDCPGCGSALNGHCGSSCPHCASALDWAAVLPLDELRCPSCGYRLIGLGGERCPECGGGFAWPAVLADARRGQHLAGLWRDRPLTALAYTWCWALLRPRRLWSELAVHHAPEPRTLALLLGSQILLMVGGWPLAALFADLLMNTLARLINSPTGFIYPARVTSALLVFCAIWYVAACGCLVLFRCTPQLGHVRTVRLLSVMAHATLIAALGPGVWCVCEMLLDMSLLIQPALAPLPGRLYWRIGDVIFAVAVVATWLHLRAGLKHVLRVPHPGWVASISLFAGYQAARIWLATV